jgi:hypothetical protein
MYKKKISSMSIVVLTLLLIACNKDLTIAPLSQGTTATFYLTQDDFIQGTNAIYNNLRSYPDRLLNLSETRSDNLYAVSVNGTRDWDAINAFKSTVAGNTYIEKAWNDDFNGVFKANNLLDQIDQKGSVIYTTGLSTRLQGEARFLRAFYYFDLLRYFGKLPIISAPVTTLQSVTIPRSPVGDVYKFIIADLQFAMQNLPANYTNTDVGRATKYAAESLLALVYMTRSGPTYSIEGPGLASNEWNLALPLLNDVINSALYTFNTIYSSIFSFSNQNPSLNKEAIFDVMYLSGLSPVLGASYPWITIPDSYFQSLGKPAEGGGESRPISNELYNSYDANDVRKSFNFVSLYVTLGVPGNRPYVKKYFDATKIPTNINDWGINFMAIRYTDVLMLKAECILNGASGGTQADVDAIVNKVRNRAGLANISNVTLSQLYTERRKEFVGEGNRWFDLQRSGNLLTIMNSWIKTEDILNQISPVIANYIIYPIPQSQLDTQPGLYDQNPGY